MKDFKVRMREHLRQFFPGDCVLLGEAGVHEEIHYGIERARSYGIVNERGICKFVDVMFVFGHNFENNAAFPWAAEILNDDPALHATDRVNFLFQSAKARIDESPPLEKKWQRDRV